MKKILDVWRQDSETIPDQVRYMVKYDILSMRKRIFEDRLCQ